MLSNGKQTTEPTTPAIAEDIKRTDVSSFPLNLISQSFASSYGANVPRLTAIALNTVGVDPLQRVNTPSSLIILPKALKKFL
jgi:hypothetical protein